MKRILLWSFVILSLVLVSCSAFVSEQDVEELESSEYDLSKLSPLQYYVTQQEGTEPPYANKYWDNEEEGIYVSIVSGEPLFSSTDKYDSRTGWPSFTKPLDDAEFTLHDDFKLGYKRVEMKAADGAHLGHIFEDGPVDKGGLRYCMNSAALEFIPVAELEERGYSEYSSLFEETA